MKKYSVPELSIVFPVKIESDDRIANLKFNLDYFETYFSDYEIILVEQGEETKLSELSGYPDNVKHFFLFSRGCHCQGRNFNIGTNLTTRPIVMNLDVDVICHPDSIMLALDLIKNGSSFVAPYNGIATEIRKSFYSNINSINDVINNLVFFPKDHNLKFNEFDYSTMYPIYGDSNSDNTGGCLIFKKEDFYAVGGWNTNFISYGFDDLEFIYRIKALGYEIKRFNNFNIYHLEHKRGSDSSYNNFFKINRQEYNHVISLSSNELLEYAMNGFKRMIFNNKSEILFTNTRLKFSYEVIKSTKMDLDKLSVIVPLKESKSTDIQSINNLLLYFEQYFINYELIIVECEQNIYQYFQYKKNIKYIWTGMPKVNINELATIGTEASLRDYIAIWDYYTLVNPKILYNRYKSLPSIDKIKIKDSNWYSKDSKKSSKGDGVVLFNKKFHHLAQNSDK